MKGQYTLILTAALMVAALMVVVTIGVSLGGPGTVEDVIKVTDTLKMITSLEGAGTYLDAALGYAIHQGCYDVLGNGGDVQGLAKAIEANLKKYTSRGFQFGGVNVVLPSVAVESFVVENEKITVKTVPAKATAGGSYLGGVPQEKSLFQKEEAGWVYESTVKLARTLRLEKTVSTACGAFADEITKAAAQVPIVALKEKLAGWKNAADDKQTAGSPETCKDDLARKQELVDAEEDERKKELQEVLDEMNYDGSGLFDLQKTVSGAPLELADGSAGTEYCNIVGSSAKAVIELSLTRRNPETYPVLTSGGPDGKIAFTPLTARKKIIITEEETE